MRVAFVHDWLLGMRGGERCLEVLVSMFPEADIYTLFYSQERLPATITDRRVVTSSLASLPLAERYHRYLLPLYPAGMRSLGKKLSSVAQLEGYDLVISISHCAAKNIRLPSRTLHICYCLTPMRYIWDQYDAYFSGKALEPLVRRVRPWLQRWDQEGALSVHQFVAISDFVRERIKTVYHREAQVIYPPVRIDWLDRREQDDSGGGFLCVSALVPYKNVHVVVEAFNSLGYPLTIVGNGPDRRSLENSARKNIKFIGNVDDQELARLYRQSKAMIFAAEEDFGMTPVECQASGRPVICLGRGGALETVSAGGGNPSGVYFFELSSQALSEAVEDFLVRQSEFSVDNCVIKAEKFSLARFEREFLALLASLGMEDLGEKRRVGA